VDSSFVAAAILVVLVGGSVALLARQRTASLGLPALRMSSGSAIGAPEPGKAVEEAQRSVADAAGPTGNAAIQATSRSVSRSVFASAKRDEGPPELEPVRLDIAPTISTVVLERLDHIEDQLAALRRELERQQGALSRLGSDMRVQAEAEDARQRVFLEQVRAEVTAFVADRQGGFREHHADVSADLYARLARLESALAAVTNPILLPGEAYAPPAELPTEALIWENWNEVGERAFALADAYSAQRLYLSDRASADLGAFITALRILLTRSVYPNLQAHPDAAQQEALHGALQKIAAELPKMRESLDREFQGERRTERSE
jgi:hypothetical protein